MQLIILIFNGLIKDIGYSNRTLYLNLIYIAIIFFTLSVVSSYVSSGSCGKSFPTTLQSLSIFRSLKTNIKKAIIDKKILSC